MAAYDKNLYPRAGWGQLLKQYFNEQITIINAAKSGASTKSFITDGNFDQVASLLAEGDYLMIQFGHNDQKEDKARHTEPFGSFKANLKFFITIAKQKGAKPVLITPVARRKFTEQGKIIDTHHVYAEAVRELVMNESIPLIDLTKASMTLYQSYGVEESKLLFLWLKPNEYINYPEGSQDDTHFSHQGAKQIAHIVVKELKQLALPLNAYLKQAPVEIKPVSFSVKPPTIPNQDYRLIDFGGEGDGRTDNTEAFKRAIETCHRNGGGRIIVESGVWMTGPIQLKSRIELHVKRDATICFIPDYEKYPLIASSFEGAETFRCIAPIDGECLEDIAITGAGIIDGSGQYWRPVKKWKMTEQMWSALEAGGGVLDPDKQIWWPTERGFRGAKKFNYGLPDSELDKSGYQPYHEYFRPNLVSLRRCKRVKISGVTLQNSPAWNIHPWICEHVMIENLFVRNPWYAQNGDGLDIESCRFVTVKHCRFDVGDDAICIKSGKRHRSPSIASEHILIEQCHVFQGHGGFVIGSEMSGDVRYVQIKDCIFSGTDKGVRIKTMPGRGGIVEYIWINNIQMQRIKTEAISIRMDYTHEKETDVGDDPALPLLRDIYLESIRIHGAEHAVVIKGLPEKQITDISLNHICFVSDRGIECRNSHFIYFNRIEADIKEANVFELEQTNQIKFDAGSQVMTE